VVLAAPGQCALGESVAGYRAAIAALRHQPARDVWIAPALVEPSPDRAAMLSTAARNGAMVILESGGAFVSEARFADHRRALESHFALTLGAPVALWRDDTAVRVPYVDYNWPLRATIRDFSRVVPLTENAGDVIARADTLPVGLARALGTGLLLYLGSPLGPALWAGDSEARQWFSRLLSL
jgi:hypothetical protein